MNKTEFLNKVKTDGVLLASLYANMMGISIAQVQLWIRTI
jgi:hypothetical protein